MRYFGLNWQFNWVSRYDNVELSPKERDRLRALALWQETKDVKLVCRTFELSRATLYRWRKRFDVHDLTSLQDRPRRPRRLRSPGPSAPQIAEGLARLYVLNISGWTLIPSNRDIIDNGKPLVSLPRLTYMIVSIPPGVHDLRTSGRKLVLNAEEGKTYFVVAGYRPERSWAFPLAGIP